MSTAAKFPIPILSRVFLLLGLVSSSGGFESLFSFVPLLSCISVGFGNQILCCDPTGVFACISFAQAKLTMMLVVNAARDTIVEQACSTGCNKKTTQSS